MCGENTIPSSSVKAATFPLPKSDQSAEGSKSTRCGKPRRAAASPGADRRHGVGVQRRKRRDLRGAERIRLVHEVVAHHRLHGGEALGHVAEHLDVPRLDADAARPGRVREEGREGGEDRLAQLAGQHEAAGRAAVERRPARRAVPAEGRLVRRGARLARTRRQRRAPGVLVEVDDRVHVVAGEEPRDALDLAQVGVVVDARCGLDA